MKKGVSILLAISVAASLLASCGGSGGGGGTPPPPPTPATATVSPPTDTMIGASQAIIVRFDRSMSPTSLALTGTMAGNAQSTWTTTTNTSDTLTVTPATNWGSGAQTLFVDAADTVGTPISKISLSYMVDATAPTIVSAQPSNGSTISATAQIVFRFSESMAGVSLTLGGTMASESNGGVWSASTTASDTLTISPKTSWTGGAKNLTITANDVAGNPLSTASYTYTVNVATTTAAATPTDGALISKSTPIVVVFSQSMNTASLSLGGSMAAESNAGTWSASAIVNDTLTVSPTGVWSNGIKGLTIAAIDTFGNPVTLNLSYDANVIFVSPTGADTNAGSHTNPLKTIQAGINKAVALGYTNTWIQNGNYSEVITMANGVSLKGGHDAAWSWSAAARVTTVLTGKKDSTDQQYVTVQAKNISLSTQVSTMQLVGPTASGTCGGAACSSYAVHAVNANNLTLDNLTITAGTGADGSAGVSVTPDGTQATSGWSGSPALSKAVTCDDTSRGVGGAGSGGGGSGIGGSGGNGGTMDTNCGTLNFNATAGSGGVAGTSGTAPYGGYGGAGGIAGAGGATCTAGQPGSAGFAGSPGAPGVAYPATGFVSSAYWVPTGNGGNGALGGYGGGGGGGGGSGGCDAGTDSYGAGGGGGGAGGRPNLTGGYGGNAGGWSFAVFATGSGTIAVVNSSIVGGLGGNGGSGGSGAAGQTGGLGGSGGSGAGGSPYGGNGGAGGNGGRSGDGAGGAGGSLYGIATNASAIVTQSNVAVTLGSAGNGGGGVSPGNSGNVVPSGAL